MKRAALPTLVVSIVSIVLAGGCGGEAGPQAPVETVRMQPLELVVEATGQLKSAKATPLMVPGTLWAQRQLVWMAPDGSRVGAGDVVARFSPAQGELELSKALLDLQRNALSRQAKQDELGTLQGRVDVDLAQVGSELGIAERYAGADLDMFARNEILDAIQDKAFLGEKRGVLEWKRGQAGSRGGAELAVLDSQKATYELNRDRRREDLDALELKAPYAGVIVHTANWSGDKPKVGAQLWAGNEFATLPDPSALEVELALPQLEAQGIVADAAVELYPIGRPAQAVQSTLTWVAGAAAVRNRQSPVKYVLMKAPVPAEAATRQGWVPGQAFRARIVVRRSAAGLSVPNVAVVSDGGKAFVEVRGAGGVEKREVTLGARGLARSEVLAGLREGEAVVLTPRRREAPDAAPARAAAEAP